eukprot:2529102-Amphidinium_carterae.2
MQERKHAQTPLPESLHMLSCCDTTGIAFSIQKLGPAGSVSPKTCARHKPYGKRTMGKWSRNLLANKTNTNRKQHRTSLAPQSQTLLVFSGLVYLLGHAQQRIPTEGSIRSPLDLISAIASGIAIPNTVQSLTTSCKPRAKT